ncbi:MAG: inorganic phosphate transporter [Eggerthellaceae bacterium]|jgi:PiT family inorganic phosphate transporter|nr:inorganic phosphate transporter [Eggerthellaceae bacterium]MDR2715136.1 inorganic phosphate transporter [Coriobacteriaceae bacterium]
MSLLIIFLVVISALAFEFINGFHDTANSIATTVYTKALPVAGAIALAASMNFLGALVFEGVAQTISKGLVGVTLDDYVILAALLGAITWNLFTWWKGIPSSSSHALIGGLLGATIAYTAGLDGIIWSGVLQKVVIPMFTSPFLGFFMAFCFMKLIYKLFASVNRRKAGRVFSRLQILSAAAVAFAHGTNDAQKTMGIITLALFTGGFLADAGHIPLWVKLLCAATMAAGTSVGGWRIMRTMGHGVTKLDSVRGFAAETSSAIVIQIMTALHAPISTTHAITTSVMGVGSARRLSAVKWGKAKDIVMTWVVTPPSAMLLGAAFVYLIRFILQVS